MNRPLSRAALLLAAVVLSRPGTAAVVEAVPAASLSSSLGAAAAPAAIGAGVLPLSPAASAPALSASALAAPSLAVPSAMPLAAPAAAPALAAPAPAASALVASAVPAAPAAVSAAPRETPAGAPALDVLRRAAAARGGRDWGRGFDGGRARAAAPADDVVFVVNDEGIKISGRAADYYQEVRRMVGLYQGQLDLSESLNVMDDSYGDVLAKVSAVEAIAKGRGISQENTHLEETLMWVDGVLQDGRRTIAVHTHRVFFHHAKNPASEIAEGIRRVDGTIREMEENFRRGGLAEQHLGRLDEVELVFDARGYQEIKDHLKKRAAEVASRSGGRIKFKYLDELAPMPKDQETIRARLNALAKKYQGEGLSKIIEGVIYSRYVGLLLELKTLEHYHNLGYKVLQSGRELFDERGHYVSELDAVVESPEGKVLLVEAKSARVSLPFEQVLQDKVIYKLETYKKRKAELDGMIGKPFDEVVFSMDVGMAEGDRPKLGRRGEVDEKDAAKMELMERLHAMEPELSARYGFPVRFLFIHSAPVSQGRAPAGRR